MVLCTQICWEYQVWLWSQTPGTLIWSSGVDTMDRACCHVLLTNPIWNKLACPNSSGLQTQARKRVEHPLMLSESGEDRLTSRVGTKARTHGRKERPARRPRFARKPTSHVELD
mmetsp:Transcript_88420/g.161956  ORF Transcript_88420/g.161956 Transcript_88420/m.161956 type:complete len:114 (-) Transcript_88420:332-673(-)